LQSLSSFYARILTPESQNSRPLDINYLWCMKIYFHPIEGHQMSTSKNGGFIS